MSRIPIAILVVAVGCGRVETPPQKDTAVPVDTSVGAVASDSAAVSAAHFTQAFYDWYAAHNQNLDTGMSYSL
jgi:hypothetical protein